MKLNVVLAAAALALLALGVSCAAHPQPTGRPAAPWPQPSTSSAGPQLPDTPAGQQFAAWLKALNSDDDEAFQGFLQDNFPSRAKHLKAAFHFRQLTGGLTLRKLEESSATKVVVLAEARNSDMFARLTLEVESDAPHIIIDVQLQRVPRPAEFALPHLSESELLEALRKKLEEATATDQFAGTVLLARNGKIIYSQAYGLADREHQIANTLETRFRLGSMNKMFTAMAILQLVQAGKIELDATVGEYLTKYPNKAVSTKVTIEQLLKHTGGTGDIFGPKYEAHRLELRTLEDYVELYGTRDLLFEPGSRWKYSNYGFVLLGLVIENVSGQDYYAYVREHIYKPAGMSSSGSKPEDQTVANRSIGYTRWGGNSQWRPNSDTLPYRGTSAGGGYSTAGDLLKFATALQEHKLLDAEHTKLLTVGKPGTPHRSYAYGFEDRTYNGTRCFGHGGGAPGMNADLKICPESGYVIAVLANLDPPAAGRISELIANRLPQN